MSARPPRLAEWLAALSLPGGDRDAVLGDLAEEFADLAAERGPRAAAAWYWRQIARSLLPNLRRTVHTPPSAEPERHSGDLMESLLADVRYALRTLGRRRTISIVAITSLVVGIALPAVVFSLLNAVLLRPLPVRDPDALAVLLEQRKESLNHNFSYPDFADYRGAQRTFEGMTAYSREDVTVRHEGGSQVVAAELVSGEYFEVVGVPARAGRTLSAADDRSGAAPVAVVSETLWRQLSGAGAHAFSGRNVRINDREFSIVGVIAAPFRGMEVGRDVRVWLPLHAIRVLDPRPDDPLQRRTRSWLTVVGRLRAGATLESGAADLTAVEAGLGRQAGRPQPRALTLSSGRQGDSILPEVTGGPLTLLFAAALLVLVVACANVSGLLLARGAERAREIAVRTALGAGRGRLARLVLVEALWLAGIGTAIAAVAARWIAGLAAPLISSFGQPVTLDLTLDWRMVAFIGALALTTTLCAALAPLAGVLRAARPASLQEGGRGSSSGPAASRTQRLLLVAQFALSLCLVAAAALLGRTVYNLRTLPTGLDIDRVVLASVDAAAAQMDAGRASAYFDQAIAAIERHPGVRRAGFGRVIPLGFGGSRTSIVIPAYTPGPDEDMEINFNTVSPGYFDALGIRVKAGRGFTAADAAGRPPVVIVNETMAARFWPGRSALGARVAYGPDQPPLEVVGVVPDVKYRALREPARPSFYVPLAQDGARRGVFHVSTSGDPGAMLQDVRRVLAGVNPAVPVTSVLTLRDQSTLNMNDERIAMLIGGALGSAALLLAAVGLYGSISYMVGQRRRELGVRIALGATAADIRRAVLLQGLAISAAGAAVGLGLAISFARLLEDRLFGVSAHDPLTLIVSAVVLTTVALLATWAPARRAARVDPITALRIE